MKKTWTLADILDMEFFFSRDNTLIEQGKETELERRDRTIGLAGGFNSNAAPATEELAHHWLTTRRRDFEQPLPGQLWKETTALTGILLLCFSLLLGAGLAATFLSYDGITPVNVSGFFAFFILLQLLVLLLQLLLFGVRLTGSTGLHSSVLYNLTASGLKNLLIKLYRRSRGHLGADKHLDLTAAIGRLRQNHHLYGALFLWPAFILLQIGGIGFNLGVLLTLIYKVGFTDIAFGWQSTLPVSEPFLAELIRLLALPWAWLAAGGAAFPGLEQIIGSKMILKDGIRQLTTADLTAWWPFLLGGVITYGLLPRLLLLCFGRFRLISALRQLPFESTRFRQLSRRMLTPSLATGADNDIPPLGAPSSPKIPPPTTKLHPHQNRRGWLVMIPDELRHDCSAQQLSPFLRPSTSDEPLLLLPYGAVDQDQQRLFHQVVTTMNDQRLAGIVLVQEAWQPPIRELIDLLRQLRHSTSAITPLSVALIGKPRGKTVLTPATPTDLQIWLKTTRTLADPYLDVFALVKNDD